MEDRILAPVGYTSFPLGLPPASTLASASMPLENTFLTPSVKIHCLNLSGTGTRDGEAGDLGTSLLFG